MGATKVAACAAWALSNCGASFFITLSRFQTTASAVNSDPSWKVTPWRSLKVQRLRSAGSVVPAFGEAGADARLHVAARQVPGVSAS